MIDHFFIWTAQPDLVKQAADFSGRPQPGQSGECAGAALPFRPEVLVGVTESDFLFTDPTG